MPTVSVSEQRRHSRTKHRDPFCGKARSAKLPPWAILYHLHKSQVDPIGSEDARSVRIALADKGRALKKAFEEISDILIGQVFGDRLSR
ncbi:MAG: hypothetical protein HYS23_02105 [Geobacter sp.]|nr:hypothetical protein [Geobacter sp.]